MRTKFKQGADFITNLKKINILEVIILSGGRQYKRQRSNLERLRKVVQSLQENSVKMGQLLAVHNEKLDKQDRIDAVCLRR